MNWLRKVYNIKIYSKKILNVLENTQYAILYRIFILIQNNLEENKLTEINKYSERILKKYIIEESTIDEEDRELLSIVMADEKIKRLISLRLLINSYYYGVFCLDDKEELFYKKALNIDDNLLILNVKTIDNELFFLKSFQLNIAK